MYLTRGKPSGSVSAYPHPSPEGSGGLETVLLRPYVDAVPPGPSLGQLQVRAVDPAWSPGSPRPGPDVSSLLLLHTLGQARFLI